ncbi:MAG TPA: FHA domain-containing protein [Xanthobacteraceae bacterium]|jgi:pSer/pThr/pTyr-binding forkhead associated (FHA) protein
MTAKEINAFLVGRSKECDVVVADPSVSRRHAEFLVNAVNDLMLADCDSTFGTFIRRGDAWQRITTARVEVSDQVRLGRYQTSIRALMTALADRLRDTTTSAPVPQQPAATAVCGPNAAAATRPAGAAPPGKVVVERDPETGEIISRKEGR